MARSVYSINDDAVQSATASAAVLTDTTKIFGTLGANARFIGYRIINVTIPNAASIRHAYLKVYCASNTKSAFTYSLNGQAADNAAAFTTGVNDISGRSLTTASFSQKFHDLPDGYRIFDVTAIVQEIVNRGGWSSGNAIAFIFNNPSLSGVSTLSFTESGNAPEFGVIYDDSADSERSPTVSGTGAFVNPNNAFSSNNSYATTTNLDAQSQVYGTYGIPDLTGNTIDGILVKVEGNVSSTTNRSEFTIELSWDGGTTWTTAKRSFQFQTTDDNYFYGGADAWSHTFTASELTNANFKIRITNDFNGATTNDSNIDYVSVKVFYHTASTSVTVNPSVLSLVFSTQAPTVKYDYLTSANVQSATFSIPTPSVGVFITIAAAVLSAVFTTQAITVLTDAIIAVAVQTATFSIQSATIVINYLFGASPLEATFSQPPATASTVTLVTVAEQTATFSIPAITVITDAILSVATQTLTFSIPQSSILTDAIFSVAALTAVFSIPLVTIVTTTIINVAVQIATFSLPLPTIITESATTIKNYYTGGISAAKRMLRGLGF